jgi:hypothetical protein
LIVIAFSILTGDFRHLWNRTFNGKRLHMIGKLSLQTQLESAFKTGRGSLELS